jgi:hemolysin III
VSPYARDMVPGVPSSERGPRVHERVAGRGQEAAEQVRERVRDVAEEVKPRLRGWLHAGITPLTLAAGIVLIVLSPTAATRTGSAIFAGTAVVLFGVSALYHRFRWGPRMNAVLRRLDHSNIFLLIAGSYTPFAITLLEPAQRDALLAIVWIGATLGVLFRVFWSHAPRLLYTPIYVALGWVAIFYAGDLGSGGPAVTTLLVVGGGLYTLGGLVYGFKRPDPSPSWFGFHEVFHLLTIAAFVCHYVAASIATYSLR